MESVEQMYEIKIEVVDKEDGKCSQLHSSLESPTLVKEEQLDATANVAETEPFEPDPFLTKCEDLDLNYITEFQSRLRRMSATRQESKAQKSGETSSKLRTLLESSQSREPKTTCPICTKIFFPPSALRFHLLHVHGEESLKLRFPKRDRTTRKWSGTTCEKCGKTFSRTTGLQYHMEHVHIDETEKASLERKFICETCGKKFFKKSHLIGHNQVHTGIKIYPCRRGIEGCKKSFHGATSRKRHEVKCHGRQVNEVKPEAPAKSQPKPKKSSSRVRVVRVPKKSNTDKTKPKQKKSPSTQCRFCNKKFQGAAHCARHERTHTGEKKFKCTYDGCEEKQVEFALAVSLTEHIRIAHTGEAPYKCNYADCNAAFGRRLSLNYHVSTKHLNRKVSCPTCGKEFPAKSSLVRHEMIHTGEKPFLCNVCGKSFRSGEKLRLHAKIHTKPPKKYKQTLMNEEALILLENNTNRAQWQREQALETPNHDLVVGGTPPFPTSPSPASSTQNSQQLSSHQLLSSQSTQDIITPSPTSTIANAQDDQLWNRNHHQQLESGESYGKVPDQQAEIPGQRQLLPNGAAPPVTVTGLVDGSYYAGPSFISNNQQWHHGESLHQVSRNRNMSTGFTLSADTPTFSQISAEAETQALKFTCGICGRRYSTETDLTIHENIHNNIGDGIDGMNKKNSNTDLTKTKLQSSSPAKFSQNTLQASVSPLQCEICHKSFNRRNELHRHQMVHDPGFHPFKCKQADCTSTFRDVVSLRIHMRAVHANVEQLACNLCGMSFSSRKYLETHRNRIHQNPSRKAANREEEPTSSSSILSRVVNLTCHACQRTFKRINDLGRHMMIHDQTILPFKCQQLNCGALFRNVNSLREHVQMEHPTLQQSKCELCQLKFNSPKTLRNHQLTVHSTAKYECSHSQAGCTRVFKTSGALKYHLDSAHPDPATQDPAKRFHCAICPKEFNTEVQLAAHKKQTHKFGNRRKTEKIFDKPLFNTCEICERNFERPWALRRHMLTHSSKEMI